MVGQPDGLIPALPRSPHQRILPETPRTRTEPGIWAGDKPKVVAPWKEREPIVIGVVLPEPDDDPLMRTQIRRCAHITNAVFDLKMRPEDLVARPRDIRACLAAYAWHHCALSDVVDLNRLNDSGVRLMPQVEERVRAARTAADAFVRARCTEEMKHDPWIAHWLSVLGREWPRFNTRGAS